MARIPLALRVRPPVRIPARRPTMQWVPTEQAFDKPYRCDYAEEDESQNDPGRNER